MVFYMKKNDIIKLDIIDMTAEGNGVGKTESGMTAFVPLTAPGDVVASRITKINKRYAYGIIDEIIIPSQDRTESGCGAFNKCGGCAFRHINYAAELKIKDKLVKDAFSRIGGFRGLNFEEICGAEHTGRYRNKAQYPVGVSDGRAECGFYSKRSHRIIPAEDCKISPKIFSDISRFIIGYVNERGIRVYDETAVSDGISRNGGLRHIYLRRGHYSSEIMVCLVSSEKNDLFEPLAKRLAEEFPEITSVVLNINPKNTNVILGDKSVTLYGKAFISDSIGGIKAKLSPMSFYQVNTAQAERLYECVKEYALMTGAETVLDLYCGAGLIGIFIADKAKEVIGAEIVREAIENAKENAADNGVKNIRFISGDAGMAAKTLLESGISLDVIITDPPRRGLDALALDSIVKLSPQRIVMVSCNPATAARDAAFLAGNGYEIKRIRAYDLFPRTGHVECVLLMEKVLTKFLPL